MLSLILTLLGCNHVFMLVVALFSIREVHSDKYTCCYGKRCPLPVFYQYVGDYQYFIDSVSVIDVDACCPTSSWLSGSGIRSVTRQSTIETTCVCKHSQQCDGDNLANSKGYTCNGGSMTDSGCPDAHVGDINLNQGGSQNAGSGNLCTYNPGGSTRGMSQRCNLPTTICVAGTDPGVFAGTYQAAGSFFNGFPYYYNYEYTLAVRYNPPGVDGTTWAFSNSSGIVLTLFLPFNLEDFSNIASLKSGQTYDDMEVYDGSCPEPTPYPTTPAPTYYYTPSGDSSNDSSNNSSADSSGVIVGVIIGVIILIGIGVAFVCWRSRQKQQIENRFVNMSTMEQ